MRNRILAGVGIAALATVGIAAPASAATAGTADLYVVHGVPDLVVDIYANGDPVMGLQDIVFGDVTAEPMALPPGDYTLDVFPGDADGEGEPALTTEVTLVAGGSYTVVAHLVAEAGSDPVITAFENNVSEIAAGEARLTVRHTAQAPAVDVLSGETVVGPFSNVSNPTGADVDVPAGDVADVAVAATGTVAPVIGPLDVLTLGAGTNTMVHAIGSLDADNLELAVITIDGLGASPEGIPAGSAGLVAEGGMSGWAAAGVALFLAALATVGIMVRRQTVSAER